MLMGRIAFFMVTMMCCNTAQLVYRNAVQEHEKLLVSATLCSPSPKRCAQTPFWSSSSSSSTTTATDTLFPYSLDTSQTFHIDVPLPDTVRLKNQSAFILFVVTSATNPAVRMNAYVQANKHTTLRPPTRYLLTDFNFNPTATSSSTVASASSSSSSYSSFWKPAVHVLIAHDTKTYASPDSVPEIKHLFDVKSKTYTPPILVSDLAVTRNDLLPFNTTAPTMKLKVTIEAIPLTRVIWLSGLNMALNSPQNRPSWSGTDRETDDVRRIIVETHPALLAISACIAMVHIILDLLAFKNDIMFWRHKEDMRGISVRSVCLSMVSRLVIFLFLLENDTSFLVLLSVGISAFIEGWKVTKALSSRTYKSCLAPSKQQQQQQQQDTLNDSTAEYDRQAFFILGCLFTPMVLGYSIYTLVCVPQRGWYSWVVNTLASVVYVVGFIAMSPQLFINYKLKSVAHLPWRALVYRAINTFIDDLFAFLIHMPSMHRISCFRDDIIFFIYLYQRWIYPTDKSRINDDSLPSKKDLPTTVITAEDTAEPPKTKLN